MSIDNNTNIPAGIDGYYGAGSGKESISTGTGLGDNFDYFRLGEGKALPISAQSEFGDTASLDDMVAVIRSHLGLA